MKKISKLLLALVLLVTTVIFASAEGSFTVDYDANNTNNCNEFDVSMKLPLPTSDEKTVVDVVFVIDKSSVKDLAGLKASTEAFIDELMTYDRTHVQYKIGVVWFNNTVTDALNGLIELNDETVQDIKDAITLYDGKGTNLHGGVSKAKEILDADLDVPSDLKYMILASDFGGYLVDDGNGNGMTRYARQYHGPTPTHIRVVNAEIEIRYDGKSFDVSDIENLVNNRILLNGVKAASGYLDVENPLESNMYSYVDKDAIIARADSDTDFSNSLPIAYDYFTNDVPAMMENGIYQTAHVLLDMKNSGYNMITLTKDYYSGYLDSMATSFQLWFEKHIGPRYDLRAGSTQTTDDIFEQIAYRVTNIFANGTLSTTFEDGFDFVENSATVVFNDVQLTPTPLANGDIGYGNPNDDIYPFVLSYDNTSEEVLSLAVNFNMKHDDVIELNYGVKYIGTGSLDDVDTTKVLPISTNAVFSYLSISDALKGNTTEKVIHFDSPEVSVSTINCAVPTPKKGDVIAHYVDEEGTTIAKDETDEGLVGEDYVTVQKVIPGYTFVKVLEGSDDVTGKYIHGTRIVTYVYKRNVTPPPVTPQLPSTGLASYTAYAVAVILSGLALMVASRKTKKESE